MAIENAVQVASWIRARVPSTNVELMSAGSQSVRTYDITDDDPHRTCGIITLGGSPEQIPVGTDIGDPGWAYFENLDDTVAIDIGFAAGTAFVARLYLPPGVGYAVYLATDSIYAQAAATGSPRLLHDILER